MLYASLNLANFSSESINLANLPIIFSNTKKEKATKLKDEELRETNKVNLKGRNRDWNKKISQRRRGIAGRARDKLEKKEAMRNEEAKK